MLFGLHLWNYHIFFACLLPEVTVSWDRNFLIIFFHLFNGLMLLCWFTIKNTNNNTSLKVNYFTQSEYVHENKKMQQLYMENKKCEPCKEYKYGRFNHCSLCNRCLVRMDHVTFLYQHCPYVMNCVAWRNHKAFLLFVIYEAMLMAMYINLLYKHVYYMGEEKYSFLFLLYIYSNVVFCTFFMIFAIYLLYFHFMLMIQNNTTIDAFKFMKLTFKEQKDYENVYD